jgi:hypothetical protein
MSYSGKLKAVIKKSGEIFTLKEGDELYDEFKYQLYKHKLDSIFSVDKDGSIFLEETYYDLVDKFLGILEKFCVKNDFDFKAIIYGEEGGDIEMISLTDKKKTKENIHKFLESFLK